MLSVKLVFGTITVLLILGNVKKSFITAPNLDGGTEYQRPTLKRDLEDIERCDVLVAYLPRLSAGTCMEFFCAKLKEKRTICVCPIENPSPWIVVHSDVIVKKFEELERVLKQG